MKKTILTVVTVLLLSMILTLSAAADIAFPRLVDDADLLSSSEESELLAMLDDVSDKHEMDIVIVTVNELDGYEPYELARELYRSYSDSNDGMLLLVSTEDSDWHIEPFGYGDEALTNAGLEYMADQVVPYLSSGEYYDAFVTFGTLCDEFIDQAKNGEPYNYDNLPKEPFDVMMNVLIALVIGLVAALIVTGIMKGQLKSVRYQAAAGSYVKANSMNVTESRDLYLYRRVTRTARPKNNSSSGKRVKFSGNGGGGKF